MTPSIFPYERRGFRKESKFWDYALYGSMVALVLAFIFWVQIIFHVGIADARDIRPQELHTLKEQCDWALEHKEKVSNYQELMNYCV